MSMTIAFDTLDYAKKLEGAGVPAAQAEQQSKILAEVLGKSVSFPNDLVTLERNLSNTAQANKTELKHDIALVRSDITLIKWMLGALMAFVVPVAIKLFMH